jgi:hypothetical protein
VVVLQKMGEICGFLLNKHGELCGDFGHPKNRTPFLRNFVGSRQLLLLEGEGQLFPFGEEGCALRAEAVEFGGGALRVFG